MSERNAFIEALLAVHRWFIYNETWVGQVYRDTVSKIRYTFRDAKDFFSEIMCYVSDRFLEKRVAKLVETLAEMRSGSSSHLDTLLIMTRERTLESLLKLLTSSDPVKSANAATFLVGHSREGFLKICEMIARCQLGHEATQAALREIARKKLTLETGVRKEPVKPGVDRKLAPTLVQARSR